MNITLNQNYKGVVLPVEVQEQLGSENVASLLEQKLQEGVVHFMYETTDGKQRVAYGTKNGDLMPKQQTRVVEGIAKAFEKAQDIVGEERAKMLLTHMVERDEAKTKPAVAQSEDYVNYFDFGAANFRKYRKSAVIAIYG